MPVPFVSCCVAVLAASLASVPAAARGTLPQLQLPPGFSVSVYSDAVPDARAMTLGADGTVFVGSRRSGKVYALQGMDSAGRAQRLYTIASGLEMPVGVAFHAGDLYVSAVSRILKYPDVERRLAHPPQPSIVTDQLPGKTHHGWRFIAFGPDGKLYVAVGAPCNVCELSGDFGTLLRMNADGTGHEIVARGIRNSVGFDWQPDTHKLWFTNNGRDGLGDDVPDDTLNRVDEPSEDFGFPWCHAGNVADPKYAKQRRCTESAQPALRLGAHVAPLGMRFYTGKMFPSAYRGALFIAEHGSWNRSKKSGYRVVIVHLNARGDVISAAPFMTGFLDGQKTLGRPVDVQPLPDGSLLVSDDYNGAIYRVAYTGTE